MLQRGDTLAAQRMVRRPQVDVIGRHRFLVGEFLEHLHHALAGLMGCAKVFLSHLVGGGFLCAAEGVELGLRHLLAQHQQAHAQIARARHHGDDTRRHRHQHRDGRLGNRLGAARKMTARDMTGFVRENADHLIGLVELHEDAGIYKDILSFGRERIDRIVIDQINPQGIRIEPRRLENRRFIGF